MEIHGEKLKWKRGEDDFIVLRAKSTLNPKSDQRWSKVINFIF